jgi:hypothetical protein
MGNLLIGICSLFAVNSFAQEWIEYQIDSTLTVTIPEHYQLIDTLGQRIVRAQIYNGLILISKVPNDGKTAVSIKTKKQLLDFYEGLRGGYIGSQHGEAISDQIIEEGGLVFARFSCRATMGDETQIRHCEAILLNGNVYAFNFWELESITEQVSASRGEFYASIKFNAKLTIQNQMSNAAGSDALAFNVGYLLGQIFVYGMITGLVVLLITRLARKKRAKSAKVRQRE